LEQDNHLLKKIVEERKTKIMVLEIIREEAIKANETLRDAEKNISLTAQHSKELVKPYESSSTNECHERKISESSKCI
jgi:hypothetical protein